MTHRPPRLHHLAARRLALALLCAGAMCAATGASAQALRRFAFAPAQATNGAILVQRTQAYDAAQGYGFTDTKDGNEMALAVKLPPGDYRVRVQLAAGAKAARTAIWAEDRRLMAAPASLTPGERRQVEFVVNTRDPSLVKSEHDPAPNPTVRLRDEEPGPQNRTWDDKLTLAFSGDAAAVQSVEIEQAKVPRLFLAGDSTVTDQGGGDYASWGQMLPRFLSTNVAVANHARSGETMKSFVASLRWDKLLSDARPGDILLIQFGHNDQKQQWPRTYVSPDLGYPAWMKALIADARQHGMQVGLVSPVARRSFDNGGHITNTLAGYDTAVRNVARELNLRYVDLTALTATLYETLGPDRSALAFASNGKDKTHHNAYGAYVIANFVAQMVTDPAAGFGVKPAGDFKPIDAARPPDPQRFEIEPADWPVMREKKERVSGS
jgi:lysophospholipase L1-like esterase